MSDKLNTSYNATGITEFLLAKDSVAVQPRNYIRRLDSSVRLEKTPFANPTFISKGTVQTTLGGVTEFRDKNGNILLTYDPVSGTISIYAGVIAQQILNFGTVNNSLLAGSTVLGGTLSGGVISGGTIDNEAIGTPLITGGSAVTMTLNNPTMGSPSSTGGTLYSPTISGTPILSAYSGSVALGADGAFAIQTYAGSAILTARLGGTTFRFASAGTL